MTGHAPATPASPFPSLLTILVPTYNRCDSLRVLLHRLIAEVVGLDGDAVQVMVSDNHSSDGTAELLALLEQRYGFLRRIAPPRHYGTAEENLAFAIGQAGTEFLLLMSDDDIVEPGAIARVLAIVQDERPDFAMINPRLMAHNGDILRDRFLPMRSARLRLSISRLVAATGFMGLVACFSTTIVRRTVLSGADWPRHLERATIYAHVALYLERLAGRECLIVNEPLVTVRLGATGLREFQRLALLSGRPVQYPWIVGIPSHFRALAEAGHIPEDLIARVLEVDHCGRFPLLAFVLARLAEQIRTWLDTRAPAQAVSTEHVRALAPAVALAPAALQEAYRLLREAATIARGLAGAGDAGTATGEVVPMLAPSEKEALFAAVRDWAGREFGRLMAGFRPDTVWNTDFTASLGGIVGVLGAVADDRRNALPGRGVEDGSLTALLERLPPSDREAVEALFLDAVLRRVEAADGAVRLRLDVGAEIDSWPVKGHYRVGTLGAMHVAVRAGHRLNTDERRDLESIDPQGNAPAVLVGPDGPALRAAMALQPPPVWSAETCESFAGHWLGVWHGEEVAVPAGTLDPLAPHRLTAGNRQALRRAVLKRRREGQEAYAAIDAARAAFVHPDAEALATLFDPSWYAATYLGGADSVHGSPFYDFIAWGSSARRNPSPWFDEDWYRAQHSVVALGIAEGAWISGYQHWVGLGRWLGMAPSVWFDSDWYLSTYPEALAAVEAGRYGSAVEHYRAVGGFEDLHPFPLFDPVWYRAAYPEVAACAGVTPLDYYLKTGMAAGHDVGPSFSARNYLAVNADVAQNIAAGGTPSALYHWLRFGQFEGRRGAEALLSGPAARSAAAP